MRRLIAGLAVLAAALLVLPTFAQNKTAAPTKVPYRIQFDQANDVQMLDGDPDTGEKGVFVRARFNITRLEGAEDALLADYRIVVEENGHRALVIDIPRPVISGDISVMLAMDTSGSMASYNRMPQARDAARTFLSKLPAKADCGLILFDHAIRVELPRVHDRKPLLAKIMATDPRKGGTAYLDAASKGVQLLSNAPPGYDRALVVMTDGVDINSDKTLEAVISEAKKHRVKIYTVGIGEPGKFEDVSTALVLDRSGSMVLPANDKDVKDGKLVKKIDALHEAGNRFVASVSSKGKVSLIPFGSRVETPRAFTSDKARLRTSIKQLAPHGETALFDAVYDAIGVLEAARTKGKGRHAVVAMTDGIDNSSRRRVGEVIARAKEAKVPLYLLGFGRESEIDRETMERLANEPGTKGKFFHATDSEALMAIFEDLSIQLHDDGIDEASLTELATATGGKYYPAKNISELKFVLEQVTKSLEREVYEKIFKSLNQKKDGTRSNVALKLVLRGNEGEAEKVVQQVDAGYQRRGLIVAEMHHVLYLGLLIALGVLIAVPLLLRRGSAT